MTLKLNCGCEPGEFYCHIAVDLWERVGAYYRYAQYEMSDIAWEAYEKQRLIYAEHFKVEGGVLDD